MLVRAASVALVLAAHLLAAFALPTVQPTSAAWAPQRAHTRPADVVRLESVGAIPPHLAGQFEEAAGFARRPDGTSLVFDRRRHAVFVIDAARTTVTRLVDIGYERGRLLRPTAFDVRPDGTFLVADAPGLQPRVSVFEARGTLLNYFEVRGTARPRVAIGNVVLNGIASARLLDDTLLMNMPEHGGLVSEYSIAGTPLRTFGELRPTGHEANADVHLAMNAALPVPAPDGHIYVVFQAGVPAFRKYTREGTLVFERLLQSRQLDPHVMTMPTEWPMRTVDGLTFPFVTPLVRTAAVDPRGNLWIATITSHVYVFDSEGEKLATYQLIGAGPLMPDALWFAPDGRLLVAPGLYEFVGSGL
jgi:hypothetical protein